jgi:hypothetical protein
MSELRLGTTMTRRAMIDLRSIALVALLAFATSCRNSHEPEAVASDPRDRYPESAAAFFDPRTLDSSRPDLDELKRRWYGAFLLALEEPRLQGARRIPGVVVYRFLWLRSFHAPLAVRVELLSDGAGILTVKQTNGHGGYDTGSLVYQRIRRLSRTEISTFGSSLAAASFWDAPTSVVKPSLDGAQWVFEGADSQRYHLVDRHSPDSGPLRNLGLAFLALGHVQTEPLY